MLKSGIVSLARLVSTWLSRTSKPVPCTASFNGFMRILRTVRSCKIAPSTLEVGSVAVAAAAATIAMTCG